MHVTTHFPCGNGRVQWLAIDTFEVEIIAYSKNPRYTTFRIEGVEKDETLTVVLKPDRWAEFTLAKLQDPVIWVRALPKGEWSLMPQSQVAFQPEAITLHFTLKAGQRLEVSTEPPRRYGETSTFIYKLSQEYPDYCSLHVIGTSMEERPLLLLRVAEGKKQKPAVLCLSGSHASEFAGEEITRGMLASVLGDEVEAKDLRARYTFDFILNANPDGNFHGWHQYNKKDWLAHNYADRVDRSWHHEFVEAFKHPDSENISSETRALVQWINATRPAFIHDAHSWEGHERTPGAFRPDPSSLDQSLENCFRFIDVVCLEAAREEGGNFLTFPTSNLCAGHLAEVLTHQYKVPVYSIEGHPGWDREKLQTFGRKVFTTWLKEGSPLSEYISHQSKTLPGKSKEG